MRFSKSRYPLLAILTATATPALAQVVDPNLQVRIENALPTPEIKPKLPVIEQVPVRRTETVTSTETVTLTPEERKRRLQKVLRDTNTSLPMDASPEALNKSFETFGIPKTERRTVKRTRVRTEYVPKVVERKTTVTIAAQSQSVFDTNAAKSNLNRVNDWVFTNSASVTVNIPIGVLDSLVFQSGMADQRYAKLVAKDIELLSNSATYIQVLNTASGPNGLASPGTTTADALSYAVSSTTVFGAGFRPYQVELFTPSITWGRSNIDLGGNICGPRGHEIYCLAGNASAAGEYTFSDIASQENFAARLQGSMTWQTGIAGLTTTATGTIQGRYYTAFPGGRQDLLLQAAARADYAVSPSIVLSGVLQVAQQFSTVRAVQWNGLTVFPVLRLKMTF
jgi:hypothetical protein